VADVVAYLDDLFFQSKLTETARQLGIDLRACADANTFVAEISNGKPTLVIADLNARANPFEAIATARAVAPDIPVIGFFSHVQIELAERARAAGCTEAMPRSKFTRDLATILARAKSEAEEAEEA
jgi:DNA-binding NtrC family response regulator